MVEYENCPYCHSKKIITDTSGPRIIIRCGECENQIDSFAKDND